MHLHHAHTPLNRVSAPPSLLQVTMGTAALGLLCAALLHPLLMFGVPAEEPSSGEAVASGPPVYCQRCCDSEDPLTPADEAVSSASPAALPYLLPEVRPYINITILKGEYPPVAQARLAWLGTGRAWGPLLGLGSVRWREQKKPRQKFSQTLSVIRAFIEQLLCARTVLNSEDGAGANQTEVQTAVLVGEADSEQYIYCPS